MREVEPLRYYNIHSTYDYFIVLNDVFGSLSLLLRHTVLLLLGMTSRVTTSDCYTEIFGGIIPHHPASSPLCHSILVEFKCINVRRNTTVFSNYWRKQLHVSALFWVGHHQDDIRISEKTHILQSGHQEWGNEISFYNVWGGGFYINYFIFCVWPYKLPICKLH
jgi:hypothetical protein